MPGSTNFQLWNPTQANQESDSQYAADAQRVGGAPNGVPFPSQTGNKAFYQWSAGIWALMTMMANKGFTVNDTNPSTLASVLGAIQTTADVKNPTQIVTGVTGALTLNAAQYSSFEISLIGSVVVTFVGQQPGQTIPITWSQPPSGGCTVTISAAVGEVWYDTSASTTSSMQFIVMGDNSLRAIAPGMSPSGINGTPIGQAAPATGSFTSLSAGATVLNQLTVTTNIVTGAITVSGAGQATVLYAQEGGSFSGHSFIGDPTTGLQSASAGTIRLVCSGTTVVSLSPSAFNVAQPATFASTTNLSAGGNLSGNFSGNPNFTGVPTTNPPGSNDSSTKIPTTGWVQALFAVLGAAFVIAQTGYIKLPSFLGNLIIQWGVANFAGGGNTSVNYYQSFPTAVINVICTPLAVSNANYITVLGAPGLSGFTANIDGSGAQIMYIALGF